MFVVAKFSDMVEVQPHDFRKLSYHAIQDNINAKYANTVVPRVGVCICLWDILSTSQGPIGNDNGYAHVNVEFRMIVFRPFKGEIITAKIVNQNKEGIGLSLGFFRDIWVPASYLQDGSEYNDGLSTWIWKEEDQEMYHDNGEMVYCQITAEEWHDEAPEEPGRATGTTDTEEREVQPPYKLKASMNGPGLGCCIWWG